MSDLEYLPNQLQPIIIITPNHEALNVSGQTDVHDLFPHSLQQLPVCHETDHFNDFTWTEMGKDSNYMSFNIYKKKSREKNECACLLTFMQ